VCAIINAVYEAIDMSKFKKWLISKRKILAMNSITFKIPIQQDEEIHILITTYSIYIIFI